MQKLKFINSLGEELDFTDGINYGVVEWNGLSEVDLNVQSQQVPFKDGAVYIDSLYSQRELSFTVAMNDEKSLAKRYTLKRDVISKMNSKLGEGYLYYSNDILEKRIKVIAQAPIFPTKNFDEAGTLKFSISFTACNPYWEDIEESTFAIGKGINELEITGDVDTEVDLYIEAIGANNLVIENETTGKKLIFPEIEDNFKMSLNTGTKSIKKATKEYTIKNIQQIMSYNTYSIAIKLKDYYILQIDEFSTSLPHGIYRTKDFVNFEKAILPTGREGQPMYTTEVVKVGNGVGFISSFALSGEVSFVFSEDGIHYNVLPLKNAYYEPSWLPFPVATIHIVQNGVVYKVSENQWAYQSVIDETKNYNSQFDWDNLTYIGEYNGIGRYIYHSADGYYIVTYNDNTDEIEIITPEINFIPDLVYILYIETTDNIFILSKGRGYGGGKEYKYDKILGEWTQLNNPLRGLTGSYYYLQLPDGRIYAEKRDAGVVLGYLTNNLETPLEEWESLFNTIYTDETARVIDYILGKLMTVNLHYEEISGNSRLVFDKVSMDSIVLSDNLISTVSPNSDMDFKLVKGKNSIKVTVDSGTVSGTMTYRNKFVGV